MTTFDQGTHEAKAASGAGSGLDVQTELTGFLNEFSAFQADISKRLKKQEDRMTMFDRKTLTDPRRPALARAAESEVPYKKAFAA